jgi:tetratricopeptide (TPR) repeat protein
LTYYNIGECYEQIEQFARAREYYKKATKVDAELSEAWLGIGVTLQEEERWFEATHYIKKALELNENLSEAWFALGDAEYRLENFEAAERAYRKVVDIDPDNDEIWLEYSHLLIADGRQEEAIDLLEQGVDRLPGNAEFIYRLACYHYLNGEVAEGYRFLSQALQMNPLSVGSVFEYAPSLKNDQQILNLIDSYKK